MLAARATAAWTIAAALAEIARNNDTVGRLSVRGFPRARRWLVPTRGGTEAVIGRRCAALSTGIVRGQVGEREDRVRQVSRDLRYFLGSTASFSCLAIRAFTTVLAGILVASPIAGLRPIRALRF